MLLNVVDSSFIQRLTNIDFNPSGKTKSSLVFSVFSTYLRVCFVYFNQLSDAPQSWLKLFFWVFVCFSNPTRPPGVPLGQFHVCPCSPAFKGVTHRMSYFDHFMVHSAPESWLKYTTSMYISTIMNSFRTGKHTSTRASVLTGLVV